MSLSISSAIATIPRPDHALSPETHINRNNMHNVDEASNHRHLQANTLDEPSSPTAYPLSSQHDSSQHYSSQQETERSSKQQEDRIKQQEIKQIRALAQRDREVKAHEQAHASVGGQYTSSPSYVYEKGPNGVQYAVAGEVSIDTSPINGDPQATIEKGLQVMRAALAPAQPSSQDRKVAAEAQQMVNEARMALVAAIENMDKTSETLNNTPMLSIYV